MARNRVTPFGTIEDLAGRGAFMGNRGCIHEGREIRRRWASKAWITCRLEYKGWRAPMWEPGRWTPLFFLDEPTALAAGHRPCALCRRAEYNRFREAFGATSAKEMDAVLHAERTGPRSVVAVDDLPAGAMVAIEDRAYLVRRDAIVPWSMDGYGAPMPRDNVHAVLLTPPATVDVLRRGYLP